MKLPNWLTMARIMMVPLLIVCYYINIKGWNYYAGGILILASLTDMFDGMAARKMHLVSNFGKLMDPIADKVLFMAALLIAMDWGKIGPVIAIVLLAREFVISGFRLVAASDGIVIAAGPIGKWKTIVQLVGIIFVFMEEMFYTWVQIPVGEILIYISVVLSIWSCTEYIYKNRQLLKG